MRYRPSLVTLVVLALVSSVGLALARGGLLPVMPAAPAAPAEPRFTYAPLVDRVADSVVNVYATRVADAPQSRGDGKRLSARTEGSTRKYQSLGSGVIVDPTGLIVTNNHVIEGTPAVLVVLRDKRVFEAKLVLRDARTDLAILRIDHAGATFPAVNLGESDTLRVGDFVLAIGNPFGVGQAVSHGIVSAVARTRIGTSDYQSFIQTDAAMNPGISGGALVDLSGRLVGICTAIFSRSGLGHGVGFATPVEMVRYVVASAQRGATSLKRPWLGAKFKTGNLDVLDSARRIRAGALVASILPQSPAARADLRPGDVVVAMDDKKIEDAEEFEYRFATKMLGGDLQITVWRNEERLSLAVALEPAPDTPARDLIKLNSQSPLKGATVANISPALAEEMALDPAAEGVMVVAVEEGSAAHDLGLQIGDIVLSVNDAKVRATRELDQLLQTSHETWEIEVDRGGEILTAKISAQSG